MKRKVKSSSGLYEYLEQQGVLQTNDAALITAAKKEYWTAYKRQWKKNRRKECKSFLVYFDTVEVKVIIKAAAKQHTSPTNFIKRAALASGSDKYSSNPVLVGKIRELLALYFNTVHTMIDEEAIPTALGNFLLEQFAEVEIRILALLHSA